MSDTVIIALASGFVALGGTCFTGWMSYMVAKLSKQQTAAAIKSEEVKRDLDRATHEVKRDLAVANQEVTRVKSDLQVHNMRTAESFKELTEVAHTTHSLVNSQAMQMARLYAISCRLNANLTHNPIHEALADAAEMALKAMEDHQEKLDDKVPNKKAPPAEPVGK